MRRSRDGFGWLRWFGRRNSELFLLGLLFFAPSLVLSFSDVGMLGGDRAGRHAIEIDAISTGD